MANRRATLASIGLVSLSLAVALAVPREAMLTASAQGTGSISGQVIWCSPLPLRAGVAGAEVPPESISGAPEMAQGTIVVIAPPAEPQLQPDGAVQPVPIPMPIPRPAPIRPIPAGAVLVAVQNTTLSARTDEAGSFRIDGVPLGQYFTVAAGPVRNAPAATAMRPNVLVTSAGEAVNVGQLALGGPCAFPRPLPAGAEGGAAPGEAP